MNWTFSDRKSNNKFKSLWKFLIVSMSGLSLNALFVFIINDVFYINPLYALIGITILTPLINFMMLNSWVFPTVK
jgi:putative flippase GtrA